MLGKTNKISSNTFRIQGYFKKDGGLSKEATILIFNGHLTQLFVVSYR